MEAPKNIYLQVCGDCSVNDEDCRDCKFEEVEDNVTWCKDRIFDKDIEYTRTDAFIEKAVEYLSYHLDTSKIDVNYKFEFIEEFRKAMKG